MNARRSRSPGPLLAAVAASALPLVAQAARFADQPEQDAVSYTIELDVDLANAKVLGSVRYRFRALQALDQIVLDAKRTDGWQPVFRRSDGQALTSVWAGDRVTLQLPETLTSGAEIEFVATLDGHPAGGLYFTKTRYGEPIAFTDHYSIRARGWLPCEDHPADRARFSVALTYPEGSQAFASGITTTDPEPARAGTRRLTTTTTADIPPYMLVFGVGPWAEVEEAGDDRLLPHLIYRQDVAQAKPALVHHAQWLQLLEQTFGEYAFGRYHVIQCPTRWGGFEAPGHVQIAEGLLDQGGGVGTLAHELAHMWFGDAVGYAQWRDVWLSEGFASYFGPWLQAQSGGPELRAALVRMRDQWRNSADGRTKSVRWDGFANPDLALNANTYPKGAWVLHMLRTEVGDPAFFAALRTYYQQHRGRSVVTADFVKSVEASTGKDLGWFFAQWLDRVGCPELHVAAEPGKLVVEQRQAGEPYRFRLRLRWRDTRGETVDRVLAITADRTEVALDTPIDGLEIDPDVELLFRAASN